MLKKLHYRDYELLHSELECSNLCYYHVNTWSCEGSRAACCKWAEHKSDLTASVSTRFYPLHFSPVNSLFFISFKQSLWQIFTNWWQERRWAFCHKSVEHELDLWTCVSTRLYIAAGSHHTNALLNITIQRFLTEKSWRTQSASTHPSMKHSWTDGCFLEDRESISLQITETLTLQSPVYLQEEERKIWAADELKLLLIVSRRRCHSSSIVSLLHRIWFIVGAAQGLYEL